MKKLYVDYESGLLESLKDRDDAAAYLNAALEDGSQNSFLMALRDVANARGLSNLARDTSLNRENMYRILSAKGNPKLSSLSTLLDSLGLKLTIAPKESSAFAVAEGSAEYR